MAQNIKKYSTVGEYGLRTLADPKDDTTADIVFVHGLTGNRETTWTEPESKVFWPEALLPGSIPTARIITFGYDADILHIFDSHKGHTLIDHASHLARALATLRSETQTSYRPLIFVAHSLGGLIVEQTLVDCRDSQDRNWNSVLESTVGIAYIGTPHTGPDLVRWQRTLTYLATMLHKTDEHVQHVLTPGAKVLAGIEKEYLTLIEARKHAGKKPISLYCFYEALEVPGVGLVVPWHSSVLSGFPHTSIHADHVGIARFGSSENAGYREISGQLKAWVDEFTTK